MSDETQNTGEESPEFSKVAVGMIIAVVVLGGIVYAGYQYSQRQNAKTTLPNGIVQPPVQPTEIDCAKPRDPNVNLWDYYNKCDQFKADASVPLIEIKDPSFGFTFKLPETAKTAKYPNGMGLAYKEINPASNLIYSIDLASSRSGEFKKLSGKAYVESYWKQYPGLSGISSLEQIQNANSEKAWKSVYLIGKNPGNTEVFFELGEVDSGNFAHFTKGIFSQEVFDNMIGSFQQEK